MLEPVLADSMKVLPTRSDWPHSIHATGRTTAEAGPSPMLVLP